MMTCNVLGRRHGFADLRITRPAFAATEVSLSTPRTQARFALCPTVLAPIQDWVSTWGCWARPWARCWARRWVASSTTYLEVAAALTRLFSLCHVLADLRLAVLCVELVDAIQLSVAIVHDATRPLWTILKGVVGSKVVAKLVRENAPRSIHKVSNADARSAVDQLIHPCVVAALIAQRPHPRKAHNSRARATPCQELPVSH